MKNSTHILITALLAVAVVALCVLHFVDRPKIPAVTPIAAGDSAVVLPIAYVTLDSLLVQYDYAKDVNEKLMASAEAKQANVNAQGRQLEKELQDFQYKLDNNAFYSKERAEREFQRLNQKREEFRQLQEKLSAEMVEEQTKVNKALSDTIISQIRTYNELHGHYQMILTNLGNSIIYSAPLYDITADVVKYLNDRYDPAKSEQAAEVKEAAKTK